MSRFLGNVISDNLGDRRATRLAPARCFPSIGLTDSKIVQGLNLSRSLEAPDARNMPRAANAGGGKNESDAWSTRTCCRFRVDPFGPGRHHERKVRHERRPGVGLRIGR